MSVINSEKFKEFREKYNGTIRRMLLQDFSNITSAKIDVVISAYLQAKYDKDTIDSQNLNFSSASEQVKQDNVHNVSKEEINIIEFIFLTDFAAYYGKTNIDIDRIDAKNFGYKGHYDQFLAYIKTMCNKSEKREDCGEGIENGILSVSRDISFEEYINNSLYVEDIDNITDLLCGDKSDNTLDIDKMMLLELFDNTFNDVLKAECAQIRERYEKILEGAFSIYDYQGVYTGDLSNVFVTIKNKGLKTISPNEILQKSYMVTLNSYIDIDISSSRQFDFEEIKNTYDRNKNDEIVKPLYFPYKVLEIVQRKELKKRTKLYNYGDRLKSCNTLDAYLTYLCGRYDDKEKEPKVQDVGKYVKVKDEKSNKVYGVKYDSEKHKEIKEEKLITKQEYPNYFRQNILEFCYYIVRVLCENDEDRLKAVITRTKLTIDDTVDEFTKIFSQVKEYLDYYVDCVTTAIVLSKFSAKMNMEQYNRFKQLQDENYARENAQWDIEDFQIKLCSRLKKSKTISNKDFVETLFSTSGKVKTDIEDKDPEEFHNVFSRNGVIEESNNEKAQILNTSPDMVTTFITLGYTDNKSKIEGMPCFAYRALESLGGEKLDWNNILLGQDENDRLVIASSTNPNLSLQNQRVHFLIAGSRSGKGVMGYNIFATALASGKPIFYIDGKPDTSVVLKTLTDKAFTINHGTFDSDIDVEHKVEIPKNLKHKVPSYLTKFFKDNSTDADDFATFRTLLLLLSLPLYLDNIKDDQITDSKILEAKRFISEISSTRGFFFVFDEFTKFQNFAKKHLGNKGLMGTAVNDNVIDTLKNKDSDSIAKLQKKYNDAVELQKAWLEYEQAPTDNKGKKTVKKPTKNKPSDKEIEELKNDCDCFSRGFDALTLYCTQFAIMIEDFMKTMDDVTSASNGAWNTFNLFFIGQEFENIDYGSSCPIYEQSGKATRYNKLDGIPFISKLMSLDTDVIVGYQKDKTYYMSQNRKGSITNRLFTPSRGFFAYKAMGGGLTKENIANIINKPSDEELQKWTFFKPFLILNNAITPDEEVAQTFSGDKEFGKRAAKHDLYDKTQEDARNKSLDEISKGKSISSFIKKEKGVDFKYSKSQYVAQSLVRCLSVGIEPSFILEHNSDENGNLRESVGFEGYIKEMTGGNTDDIVKTLNLATEVMNRFVLDLIGYPAKDRSYDGTAWIEFVYDFRPQWMYSIGQSFWNMDGTPKKFEERLTVYGRMKDSFKKDNKESYDWYSDDTLDDNDKEEIEKLKSSITVNERTAIKYDIEEQSFDNDKQEEPILDSDITNSSELHDSNLSDQEVQQGLNDLLGDDAPIIIDNEDKPSQSVISDNNGIKIVSKWEMLGRLHDYLTEMVQTECTRRGIDITSANGKKIQCQVANEIREDNSLLAVFVRIYKKNFPNTEVNLNE